MFQDRIQEVGKKKKKNLRLLNLWLICGVEPLPTSLNISFIITIDPCAIKHSRALHYLSLRLMLLLKANKHEQPADE